MNSIQNASCAPISISFTIHSSFLLLSLCLLCYCSFHRNWVQWSCAVCRFVFVANVCVCMYICGYHHEIYIYMKYSELCHLLMIQWSEHWRCQFQVVGNFKWIIILKAASFHAYIIFVQCTLATQHKFTHSLAQSFTYICFMHTKSLRALSVQSEL